MKKIIFVLIALLVSGTCFGQIDKIPQKQLDLTGYVKENIGNSDFTIPSSRNIYLTSGAAHTFTIGSNASSGEPYLQVGYLTSSSSLVTFGISGTNNPAFQLTSSGSYFRGDNNNVYFDIANLKGGESGGKFLTTDANGKVVLEDVSGSSTPALISMNLAGGANYYAASSDEIIIVNTTSDSGPISVIIPVAASSNVAKIYRIVFTNNAGATCQVSDENNITYYTTNAGWASISIISDGANWIKLYQQP